MNKKYFFFDIDGTLSVYDTNGPKVSDKTKETIKRLKENGHFVAIATGRSFAMSQTYLDIFNIDNMVCDGGNGICIDSKLVLLEPLNKDYCVTLAKECVEKNIPFAFSPDNSPNRTSYWSDYDDYAKDTYLNTIVDTKDISEYENIYKMYVVIEKNKEYTIESLSNLPWLRYGEEYIFVEPMNKSHGIKLIMDKLQADYKDVVVFGDQKNDLSMFLDEWTCIAMGNAVDELKEKADYITKSVEEDGVYHACLKFGWI